MCNKEKVEDFAWQPRFNDRVIRDMEEYQTIVRYIQDNVRNWDGGKNEFPH
jgi:hypothetical protein